MADTAPLQKTDAENHAEKPHLFRLSLTVGEDRFPCFFQLLQRGFRIKVRKGMSLRTILCQQPGITPEYLEERIQTLFIDGKAVDDVSHAIPAEGSIVALSAAMPGLVGATLRRGGFYAAMRSQITHESEEEHPLEEEIMIRMKLFNLLIRELGKGFLQKGLYVDCGVMEEFLKGQTSDFWEGCRAVDLDGRELSIGTLQGMNWACDGGQDCLVFLRVTPVNSEDSSL